jgi:uncharacterized coiled-coil protein SlyX
MAERVEDLEVKVAFLERDLRELDDVVRDLVGRIIRMETELNSLRERVEPASVHGGLEEEVPPHSVRW